MNYQDHHYTPRDLNALIHTRELMSRFAFGVIVGVAGAFLFIGVLAA